MNYLKIIKINTLVVKKENVIVLLLAACFSVNSHAQFYQKNENGIKATTDSLNIEIQFYSPSILRIVKSPIGRQFTKENLSVIKTPKKTSFTVKQQGNILNLKSESVMIYRKGLPEIR